MGDEHLGLHLLQRAARHVQEVKEVLGSPSSLPFGDIARNRYRGTADLVREPEANAHLSELGLCVERQRHQGQVGLREAQADLLASLLLAPLHLQADNPNALETQIYQAILERRSAPIVPLLQGMLAKPDPALGFTNGELRFWLGWAQEISGNHTGARETWSQARRELESFLGEHPKDYILLGHLALTDAALGDKAAAITLAEQAMAAMPIDKDAVSGPKPVEILARVAAQLGEADRAMALLQKLMIIPYSGPLRGDPRFQELCKDKLP